MKKFLLLFVTLLTSVFSLYAQQIQPSALRQIQSLQQKKNPVHRLKENGFAVMVCA